MDFCQSFIVYVSQRFVIAGVNAQHMFVFISRYLYVCTEPDGSCEDICVKLTEVNVQG